MAKTKSPVLCPDPCSCVGFHWRPAVRVCGGLHLALSSGQCRLWGPILAGHCGSTALHRTPAGWDCTEGRCQFRLSWCHRKGKKDKKLHLFTEEYLHFLASTYVVGQKIRSLGNYTDHFLVLEFKPWHSGHMLWALSTATASLFQTQSSSHSHFLKSRPCFCKVEH